MTKQLGLPGILIFTLFAISGSFPGSAAQMLNVAGPGISVGVARNNGSLQAIEAVGDPLRTNFVAGKQEHPSLDVANSNWTGDLRIRSRRGQGAWQLATSSGSAQERKVTFDAAHHGVEVRYSGNGNGAESFHGFSVVESYRPTARGVRWSIRLQNQVNEPLEIGSLGLPLLLNTLYVQDAQTTYQHRVIRHSYIAGSNSFVLVTRANGDGPFLLMQPVTGTGLEFFKGVLEKDKAAGIDPAFAPHNAWEGLYVAYIHAAAESHGDAGRSSWRQPLTSLRLAPAGQTGDAAEYAFELLMVPDYPAAQNAIVAGGQIAVATSPGMVVPTDLPALVSLRTHKKILKLSAEYPGQTTIDSQPAHAGDRHNYRFTFSRLGENEITIAYGNGETTRLEYFVTEPLSTLIQKRANFLVNNQQVHEPGKWFDGLFSLWDMRTQKLRTPEDDGGIQKFLVGGSDDADMSKAPFIAGVSLAYPNDKHIAAIEYYLQHFVWGGLQRREDEIPYPFGIYGTDSWYVNRNSKIGYNSGGNGREHMWRTFDYPHLIQLYVQMYRLAKLYPDKVHYLTADQYLHRAYGTSMAYFEVPYQIKMGAPWFLRGYSDWAFKQGNFHELYILDLITALRKENQQTEADRLEGLWKQKVSYFLNDHPYPYGSEMFFDTTAFESTHAIARYAEENAGDFHAAPWTDKNVGKTYEHLGLSAARARDFEKKEIRANIAARGYLEQNYYQLGSDIRQEGSTAYLLGYMTQMGGWSILDYGLHDIRPNPEMIRLGFASYLAGWAVLNSGNAASDYGYWYPGKANDGAAAWGFNPSLTGRSFLAGIPKVPRGIWPYDAEIDNGFSGSLRAARTIVYDDPLFGTIAEGGLLETHAGTYLLQCRDGLNQRIDIFSNAHHARISLDQDGFSSEVAQRIGSTLRIFSLTIENRLGTSHVAQLNLTGLPMTRYRVKDLDSNLETTVTTKEGVLLVPLTLKKALAHLQLTAVVAK